MNKREATKAGNALKRRLRGKGWKLHLWKNNLSNWCYKIYNGPLSVHLSGNRRGEFFCLLSSKVGVEPPADGSMLWSTTFSSRDPNKAVVHEINNARRTLNGYDEAVEYAEGVIGISW